MSIPGKTGNLVAAQWRAEVDVIGSVGVSPVSRNENKQKETNQQVFVLLIKGLAFGQV